MADLDVTLHELAEQHAKLREPVDRDPRFAPLTRREREVVSLLANGLSDAEIAVELVVARDTVRTHIKTALRKLDARNRTHIAAMVGAAIARSGDVLARPVAVASGSSPESEGPIHQPPANGGPRTMAPRERSIPLRVERPQERRLTGDERHALRCLISERVRQIRPYLGPNQLAIPGGREKGAT